MVTINKSEIYYGYVYKVTCINGLIYIGQHKSGSFDPKYLGSGIKLIKKNIKAIEILEFCTNAKELTDKEYMYINKHASFNPSIGLNVKYRRNGFSDIKDSKRIAESLGDNTDLIIEKDNIIVTLTEKLKEQEKLLLQVKGIVNIESMNERELAIDDYIEEELERRMSDYLDYMDENNEADGNSIYNQKQLEVYDEIKSEVEYYENGLYLFDLENTEYTTERTDIIKGLQFFNTQVNKQIEINQFWYQPKEVIKQYTDAIFGEL